MNTQFRGSGIREWIRANSAQPQQPRRPSYWSRLKSWLKRKPAAALSSHDGAPKENKMAHFTEDQIKFMVNRFLSWRLPSNFNPDAGISFKAAFNEHTAHPMKHEPLGTNLFDATQADAMVRHMIEGLPSPQESAE